MRHLKRGVPDLTCLLTEDRTQQSLLCGQLCLSLGSDLTHQDVSGSDLSTYPYDAVLIQILQSLFTDTGHITCDLLGSELRVSGLALIFLYIDGSEYIISHQTLADQHRILVVVSFPCHESDQGVLTQSELSVARGGTVCYDLTRLDMLALDHNGSLVIAVRLVGSHKL